MATPGQTHINTAPESATDPNASNAVEMSNMDNSTGMDASAQSPVPKNSTPSGPDPTSSSHHDMPQSTPSAAVAAANHDQSMAPTSTSEAFSDPLTATKTVPTDGEASSSMKPLRSRLDSVAIGPATDASPVPVVDEANPVCMITLLLGSGARHPYKLDERYLTKRNVDVPGVTEGGKKDPFSISVYTLKELILREWRDEWEAQPSSPSSIRLIHFGRLLDDKTPLKECRFNADTPNVVHMSIKPQDMVDEEEAAKGKALRGEREPESTPGCRCVIL